MKLRLSVSRKAGAPGYGSDGAAAEIELEIDDEATPDQIAKTITPTWYLALETAVGAELSRMQAKHPQPEPRPQSRLEGRPAAAQQQPAPEPEPRRWNPDDVPPRPAQRRPEPGWDERPDEPQRAPERGYGGRNGQRNGSQRDDPPRNGRQLAGWMNSQGMKDAVVAWGKANNLPWQVKTWPDDAVTACYHDLNVRTTAGSWGGN